jgi:hypothetical protein
MTKVGRFMYDGERFESAVHLNFYLALEGKEETVALVCVDVAEVRV